MWNKTRSPDLGSVSTWALLALGTLILAGCEATPHNPLPYSPNYHVASTATAGGSAPGVIRKGYETAPTGGSVTQAILVPDACVTPDVVADRLYLPSGCANAANLQMMVVDQSDLIRGRTPGPAMAAPAARAAREVIDGTVPEPQVLPSDVATTATRY